MKTNQRKLNVESTQLQMAYRSQLLVNRARWASYAAIGWCAVFGGFHLYWAMGGTFGFEQFSMPPNKSMALTRDPFYIAITWGVVVLCLVAAFTALATFQVWSRRLPRWLVLAPLWIASGLFLVRGIGNLIQTAFIISGLWPFETLQGPDTLAWQQWMRMDTILFSPWFILGGLAFGATAYFARRHGYG